MQRRTWAVYVCHATGKATESRMRLLFANEWHFPAIIACEVDRCSTYPTRRPLIIEANVEKMEKVTRELQKTMGYAKMLEDKIQGIVQVGKAKAEAEEEAHRETVQAGSKANRHWGLTRTR